MAKQSGDRWTGDILRDWEPPTTQIAATFKDKRQIQGHSLDQRIALCVGRVLKDSDLSREEIACQMSEYLGASVSKGILDSYSSQSKTNHPIGLARTIALVSATNDPRLLGEFLSELGYAVIEKKYLGAVEEAMWAEREEQARRERENARRKWKRQ